LFSVCQFDSQRAANRSRSASGRVILDSTSGCSHLHSIAAVTVVIQSFSDSLFEAECLFKRSNSPRKAECTGRSARSRFNTFKRSTATTEASPENSRTLKVEQRTAPCSNGMRGRTARRVLPPGMKQFPVGHCHKQGYELIIPGTDLQWMGGKKP
jgi:hypothetical protein